MVHSCLDSAWQLWLSARFSIVWKWSLLRIFWGTFLEIFWEMIASSFEIVIVNMSKLLSYFILRQLKIKLKSDLSIKTRALRNRRNWWKYPIILWIKTIFLLSWLRQCKVRRQFVLLLIYSCFVQWTLIFFDKVPAFQ